MLRRLAVLATLVGALAPAGGAAAATSSNWAGYVATAPAVRFTRVSATWIQPAVTCTAGQPTFLASWVGLGGNRDSSTALEQIGTEADCRANGRASYSSWFELVPSAAGSARLGVRPGDLISASVTVRGRIVRLRMADATTGRVFTRSLRAQAVDLSSADWIVEAPTVCQTASAASCQATTLADFGATGFSSARATGGGHAGAIGDPAWSPTAISLIPGGPARAAGQDSPTAVPGSLSAGGDAFSLFFGAAPPGGGVGP